MTSSEQKREEFNRDNSTPENPPVFDGEGCTYYVTGAQRFNQSCGSVLAPPPPDKRERTRNTLRYWELREDKAVNEFEAAKEEALSVGRLTKTVRVPPQPMIRSGKTLRRPNGQPICHPETTKEVLLSDAETKQELLRLREQARHCMLQRADADEAFDVYRPRYSSEPIGMTDLARSEHLSELRDIEL